MEDNSMVKSYINLAEEVGNKMNTQLFYRAMLLKFFREWIDSTL